MRKTPPIHKAVQKNIYKQIPKGEGFLEYSLPNHFADVIWINRKIIFEVQCSYISLENAIKRTSDYEKLGYTVVWILHQKFFNRRYVSSTEHYLRSKVCYFTDIAASGHGQIYDQFETFKKGKRHLRSSRFIIDLSKPIQKNDKLTFQGDRHTQVNHLKTDFKTKSQSTCASVVSKIIKFYDKNLLKFLKTLSH